MKKLEQLLTGKIEENHITTLFWQSGMDEQVIREYMGKIQEAGIQSVCAESRTHPDFLGDGWWHDMDIIMDEARKRNMTVWVFDDARFPTGYANGRVVKDFPEYRKKYLKIAEMDFVGPSEETDILLFWSRIQNRRAYQKGDLRERQANDRILGVVAAKVLEDGSLEDGTRIVLSGETSRNLLRWSFPEGHWKVFILVETDRGGEPLTADYLNPLKKAAANILIEEAYETHYQHYGADFGKTFAGFFSDEPHLGNEKGPDCVIGKKNMLLPWSEEVEEGLLQIYSGDKKKLLRDLPLLTVCSTESEEAESRMRCQYMDLVSSLYAENFSKVLGDWCVSHGCQYMGHIIEDNGAHSRLGYGCGHFFRSMSGQTMAGVDIVMNQLMPGFDFGEFKAPASTGWDGEFFHYLLAKLGSSLGKLDARKQGVTMCEVFGAYGWNEGMDLMKFIVDHMLVRGINYFVPHAFSAKPFPDVDCPPHFYAHGNNPLYPYMKVLMDYTNRMCSLLKGGRSQGKTAVLYTAEGEWSGNRDRLQKTAKCLIQNQIDFEIVPLDYVKAAEWQQGRMVINGYAFEQVVFPEMEKIPPDYLEWEKQMEAHGIGTCHVVNSKTEGLQSNEVSLELLPAYLEAKGVRECKASGSEPYLRAYHYKHEDGDVWMFFNEDASKTIHTEMSIKQDGYGYEYQAFFNQLRELDGIQKDDQFQFRLELEANQSIVLIFTKEAREAKKAETRMMKEAPLKSKIVLSCQEAGGKEDYRLLGTMEKPDGIRAFEKELETFSGTLCYELEADLKKGGCRMEITGVSDAVEVEINGKRLPAALTRPYAFDLTEGVREGKNEIKILVTNSLGRQQRDYFSSFILLNPLGIRGDIKLFQ